MKPSTVNLPPAEERHQPTAGMLPLDHYRVAEWNPSEDGSAAPTQVHLVLDLGEDLPRLALRLKSPQAVDTLIAALVRHRNSVWGGGPG